MPKPMNTVCALDPPCSPTISTWRCNWSQLAEVFGRLRLDLDRYEAHWDDQPVALTLTEFGILRTLIERPGKVCSRDHLMNTAYELHKIVSDRTIDSHVRRVRAKFAALGADPVETLHGVGYRLGPCE